MCDKKCSGVYICDNCVFGTCGTNLKRFAVGGIVVNTDSTAEVSNNLEPFNLDRALRGEKVVTRDGRSVELRSYYIGAKYPLSGKIEEKNSVDGEDESWYITGRLYDDVDSSYDLFMAPKPPETERKILYYAMDARAFGVLRDYYPLMGAWSDDQNNIKDYIKRCGKDFIIEMEAEVNKETKEIIRIIKTTVKESK